MEKPRLRPALPIAPRTASRLASGFAPVLPILIAVAWLFPGCAVNLYHPYDSGIGYSEVEVGKNKFEIMFHGSEDQDELAAKNYAIVRAAEIGRANNFAFMRIENGKTKETQDKETVSQTDQRSYPDYAAPGPGWKANRRVEKKTVTRTYNRPEVKIVVDYQNQDCGDCLPVDARIKSAIEEGILKK